MKVSVDRSASSSHNLILCFFSVELLQSTVPGAYCSLVLKIYPPPKKNPINHKNKGTNHFLWQCLQKFQFFGLKTNFDFLVDIFIHHDHPPGTSLATTIIPGTFAEETGDWTRSLRPGCFTHGERRLRRWRGRKLVVWVGCFQKLVGFLPKSSILIGFSIINHPFWGTPIFGNIQLVKSSFVCWWDFS